MVHITDAASATVAAIERGKPGIYHVADDEPAPVRDILQELARVLGAKPPRRVPAWLARLVAGKGAVDIMTRARGISSEKAKRELGWTPRCPSWRTGFTDGLGSFMRGSDWCRLLGLVPPARQRPCRRHIAAKDAVALSDTATQPNVRICRESRASPRPSRRRKGSGKRSGGNICDTATLTR